MANSINKKRKNGELKLNRHIQC